MPNPFIKVSQGIYRYKTSKGQLYERIKSGGRNTYKKLNVATLQEAKHLRMQRALDRDHESEGLAAPRPKPALTTAGHVLDFYVEHGCPDRVRVGREGKALTQDMSRIKILQAFWREIAVPAIRLGSCDEYADWRLEQTFNFKRTKGRAIDLELNTLRNALYYALRREKIFQMPIVGKWPIYATGQKKHCYQFRPYGGNELHQIAQSLFAARGHRSECAGFLYLFLAMTGSRVGEAVAMRWDAPAGGYGFIEDWKFLHTKREKGGVNPWIQIHPALEELLRAMKAWRDQRHAESPWFFPSWEKPQEAISEGGLGRALAKAAKRLNLSHRTPHGARAYYVTVRRSQRISDAVIAAEIGHTTGGSTLVEAYGGIPQNWYIAGHPELTWLPVDGEPAWKTLPQKPDNIVPLPSFSAASNA